MGVKKPKPNPASAETKAFKGRDDIWADKKERKERVGAKSGRIGEADRKLIAKMVKADKTVEEICEATGRSLKQVSEHLAKFYGVGEDLPQKAAETAKFVRELEKRPEWLFRKSSFSPEEVAYYQHQYSVLMDQFKDDILPTEEMQIFDLVDNLILANRSRKRMYDAEMEVKSFEHEMEMMGHPDFLSDEEKRRLETLDGLRKQVLAQSKQRTQEWETLGKKKDAILDKLRATRHARVLLAENNKTTFVALVKSFQEKKVKEREGQYMEFRRISTDQAKEKYSQPYKYMNGEWDQPILRSDNVLVQNPVVEEEPQHELSLQTMLEKAEALNG